MATEPLVARLVGEGVERPNADNQMPLDINYARISEWLVSRQKLPKDWHKRIQAIQAKAAESVKDVPASVLASLPGGSEAPLDYFRAVAIRDALAATSERTIFGGLTGSASIWDKVVKAYEKQAVYLGEAAQTLLQNVDFDIPYLRKQMAKHNQQIVDCDRKEAEYFKNAAACAANYKEECKKLGIEGRSVRSELRCLAHGLPGMLLAAVESLHSEQLQAACAYYSAFTQFAHKAPAGSEITPQLPILSQVMAGQTEPPAASAMAPASATSDSGPAGMADTAAAAGGASTAGPIDIQWDLGSGAADECAGREAAAPTGGVIDINWDLDLDLGAAADAAGTGPSAADPAADPGPAGASTMNWDIDMTDAGTGTAAAGAAAVEIDWDVDMQARGAAGGGGAAAARGTAAGGVAEAEAELPKTADGVAALRLEHDVEYRTRLLDDLQELRAFLIQRKLDLGSRGGELMSMSVPDAVSSVDHGAVAGMLTCVDACLASFTAPQLRQLLLIATSQRYLDRMEASLQRKAGQEAKMQRAIADVRLRRNEARSALVEVRPKLDELVGRMRSVKARVEAGISGLVAGHRINVLGEINNVLHVQAA